MQRERPPFLKLRLVYGCAGARAGGQGQTSQTKIYEMISSTSQKQTKCPPFSEIMFEGRMGGEVDGRGSQTGQRKVYCMFVLSIVLPK